MKTEELIAENNSSMVAPPPPTEAQQSTPQARNREAVQNQGSASPSIPQGYETPSSSSATPSTSSANRRRPRFKNLNEIYEQEEVDNSASLIFIIFSC